MGKIRHLNGIEVSCKCGSEKFHKIVVREVKLMMTLDRETIMSTHEDHSLSESIIFVLSV